MAQKETVNTFTGGMVMDTHPLTTPNNVLTNCLNGTLVTFNGNEMILQNDMGNAIVESKKNGDLVKLPDGFVPVGTTEKGGIIYIVSHNPKTKECQIGSFPSPETRKTSYERGNKNSSSDTDLSFLLQDDPSKAITVNNTTYYPLIKGNYKIDLIDTIVKTGDQYLLILEEDFDSKEGYKISLIATTDRNEIIQILDFNIIDYDSITVEDPGEYLYYKGKNGKFSLLITPDKPDIFDISYEIDNRYRVNLVGLQTWDPEESQNQRVYNGETYYHANSINDSSSHINIFTERHSFSVVSGKISFYKKNYGTVTINSNILDFIIKYTNGLNEEITEKCTNSVVISRNNLFGDNEKVTIELYPLTPLGYVEELKQTLVLDQNETKIEGVTLQRWKYNVFDNRLLLSYGFNGYIEDSQESHVELTFVKYSDIDSLDISQVNSNDKIIYNLPYRSSNLGVFSEYIYFKNSGQSAYDEILQKDQLYAVIIKYYERTSLKSTFYRWLYTCKVFNDDYEQGDVNDFDILKLKLNLIPHINTSVINPSNTSSSYNTELLNADSDRYRRGITLNSYEDIEVPLDSSINFENDYDGLFDKGSLSLSLSNLSLNNKNLITPETDDPVLSSQRSDSNTNDILSHIYTQLDGYQTFYDQLTAEIDTNLKLKVNGQLYNKIYCSTNSIPFTYECIIAPIIYNAQTAAKHNLVLQANHFLNNKVIVCTVLPRKSSEHYGYTMWSLGTITIDDGILLGNYLKTIKEDIYKYTYDAYPTRQGEFTENQTLMSALLEQASNCTLIPIIFIETSLTLSLYDKYIELSYGSNFLVYLSSSNHLSNGTQIDEFNKFQSPYVVTLQCKDDEGKMIFFNQYKKLDTNQKIKNVKNYADSYPGELISKHSEIRDLLASNLSRRRTNNEIDYTFGDIIFNILNQIYVKYDETTELFRNLGNSTVNVASDIKYIKNYKAKLKIELKGNITISNNTGIKIGGKNYLDLLNFNNNNLTLDGSSQYFNEDYDLSINVKNNLIDTYEKLSNIDTIGRIKFLNSSENMQITNINNIGDLNLDLPMIIKRSYSEEGEKFALVNWSDLDSDIKYVFDYSDNPTITVEYNSLYKVTRSGERILKFPNCMEVNENKELRLSTWKYLSDNANYNLLFVSTNEEYLIMNDLPENLYFELLNLNTALVTICNIDDLELISQSPLGLSINGTYSQIVQEGDTITINNVIVTPNTLLSELKVNISSELMGNLSNVSLNPETDELRITCKDVLSTYDNYVDYEEDFDNKFVDGKEYKIEVIKNNNYSSNFITAFKDKPNLVYAKDSNSIIYPISMNSDSGIDDRTEEYLTYNCNNLDDFNYVPHGFDSLQEYMLGDRIKVRFYKKPTENLNFLYRTIQTVLWGSSSYKNVTTYYEYPGYDECSITRKFIRKQEYLSAVLDKTQAFTDLFKSTLTDKLDLKYNTTLSDIISNARFNLTTYAGTTFVVLNGQFKDRYEASFETKSGLENNVKIYKLNGDNWELYTTESIEEGTYKLKYIYAPESDYTIFYKQDIQNPAASITYNGQASGYIYMDITVNNIGYDDRTDMDYLKSLIIPLLTIRDSSQNIISDISEDRVGIKFDDNITNSGQNSIIPIIIECDGISNSDFLISGFRSYATITRNSPEFTKDSFVIEAKQRWELYLTTKLGKSFTYYVPLQYVEIYRNPDTVPIDDGISNGNPTRLGTGYFTVKINIPGMYVTTLNGDREYEDTIQFSI